VFPKHPYVLGHLGILKQGRVQRGIGTWNFGRGLGVGFWPSNSRFFPKLPSPPRLGAHSKKKPKKTPTTKG